MPQDQGFLFKLSSHVHGGVFLLAASIVYWRDNMHASSTGSCTG